MASNMESLWYDHYQGAVYPLDLHAQANCAWSKSPKGKVPTLTHLCAAYIVKDSTMTYQAVEVMPQTLCLPLMHEALLGNRDRAIEVLLSHWPLSTMSLSGLAPPVFTSLLPLYNSVYLADIVRQSLRYTTTMAHTFIESLRKRQPTNLRYLDLTGYPTAEVIVYFLASHVMLAFTESQQNKQIRLYNDTIPSYDRPDLPAHIDPVLPSLPENCSIMIKLDAFVTSESTHSELCKALKVSSFPHSRVRLCIVRLGATCLGEARLSILLKVLIAEYVQGLQLKYNSLTIDDIVKLSPAFSTLVNLTALDLSCNSIYFYMSDAATDRLSETFTHMPNLARLDLSNNRIKTKLRRLLSNIPKPLQYLRVAACGLTVSDITYLSVSHHTMGLCELDLSENSLGPACRNLSKLLSALANTLLVFEAEDCGLMDEHFEYLLPSFSMLKYVLFLNLAENRVSREALVYITEAVAQLPQLKVFRTSYPTDCYHHDSEEIEEEERITTVARLRDIVSKTSESRPQIGIMQLVVVELERIFMDES
ncbi:leucine-rich repeat-containing protein 14-like isoform X1 [Haliotis rufescens]|uniref:leucine-rich repeat-containing protein 14-like isoform X1 n=1 Tax=Haliotis rufescens TaxID=6454 RepID=UPI001EB09807|nr:leucine-rich repeat-containing protein 14-like isoform X1 [Haliotis rufescens]XP_046362818.1 leucine-rich repeat-containing protein 14-like isoform X1 [Haliotis rufescens]XP_046362827.1 leucine-rich repeat-containing protein 14-like isoform X1 [Haliotis rufescens]XP_046362835.1 leucine-rich repeat-containing protein 14-like isoform X1 [Haliotis rufescens]XP_046362855.1 leucine-rich repeat-containing protein 14-like isoform X1 [Haliotis rufescens]XP_048258635.1 leucine-rich repeat-containing